MTDDAHSAWNPGLTSDIPRHLKPLITLFRPEHGFVDYANAQELADLTGLALTDIACLRPQRLLLHILLVRVTADLSVPDGPMYEELGINLRAMVHTIYTRYMTPELDAIIDLYSQEKTAMELVVKAELSEKLDVASNVSSIDADSRTTPADNRSIFQRLFRRKPSKTHPILDRESVALSAINEWRRLAKQEADPARKAAFNALAKVLDAVVGHRGNANIDNEMLAMIATNMVANTYVAQRIGEYIQPMWNKAIDEEGYRRLPTQEKPVIMNVKGASASGKSTIRPQQRQLAERLNIPWDDFALISPDYWRKYLLDYASLGDEYKYGAMLTGAELEMIDKKLDRYMEAKAANGNMPHLLIDRFRFDSFTVDIDKTVDSQLLSRFGEQVFLFFIITPPAETVERAWLRGLDTGRYKAVDDLLYHNVEAYTGMPSLFLSWANSKNRRVHFEFLDNSVKLGELPKTVAFGWNGIMTILDIDIMLRIDQYRQVEIKAQQSAQVLKHKDSDTASSDAEFVMRCTRTVKQVDFADADTLLVYASVRDGKLVWWDQDYIAKRGENARLHMLLAGLGYEEQPCQQAMDTAPNPICVEEEHRYTVGQWQGVTR